VAVLDISTMVLRDNLLQYPAVTPTSLSFKAEITLKSFKTFFIHFQASATAGKLAQRFASVNLEVPSRRYDKVNKYLSAIEIFVLAKND
jgi:hypothetical protein